MDFQTRNAVRQQQRDFAWTRQVGDRIQLYEDWGGYKAWDSGEIIALTPGYRGFTTPLTREYVAVRMADGGILQEEPPTQSNLYPPRIPILPHEDYFIQSEGDE